MKEVRNNEQKSVDLVANSRS